MKKIKYTLEKIYLLKLNPGLGFECGLNYKRHPFYPVMSFLIELKKVVFFIFEIIYTILRTVWHPFSLLNFNKKAGTSLLVCLIFLSPIVSAIQSSLNEKTRRIFCRGRIMEPSSVCSRFDDIIVRASERYKIDAILIKSIIKAESDFDPRCVSRAGASGLMQLMPNTARLLGVKNVFDPEENIMAGTKFFTIMMKEFDFDVKRALAAYNAGPRHVKRYSGIPPFPETKAYVSKVVKNYKYFAFGSEEI